jgi:hypothetical protein
MKLALIALGLTATVDLFILFGLESRGSYMGGVALLIAAIYIGGTSLLTAPGLCLAKCFSPQKFDPGSVAQVFAVAFFFLQFALVREAGNRLMRNDVDQAKAYCSVVIDRLKRNGDGKYPATLDTTSLPSSVPRLLKRRPFYATSDDQKEYTLFFSWDFDYAWVYSSKHGKWRFSS